MRNHHDDGYIEVERLTTVIALAIIFFAFVRCYWIILCYSLYAGVHQMSISWFGADLHQKPHR